MSRPCSGHFPGAFAPYPKPSLANTERKCVSAGLGRNHRLVHVPRIVLRTRVEHPRGLTIANHPVSFSYARTGYGVDPACAEPWWNESRGRLPPGRPRRVTRAPLECNESPSSWGNRRAFYNRPYNPGVCPANGIPVGELEGSRISSTHHPEAQAGTSASWPCDCSRTDLQLRTLVVREAAV